MFITLKRAVIVTVLLWIMLALGFTFVLVGLGQVFFPYQANGSVVTVQGRPIAARHVGQYFGNRLQYFWGRPSATVSLSTGKPDPYNALNSGASNYGPTNALLLQDIRRRVNRYLHTTPGLTIHQIPLSLVESSGSGLDPDITVASALIQVPRVSKYTGLPPSRLRQLVLSQVLPPDLGLFGPKRINVVMLNLALYHLLHRQSSAK
jgi:K+-transporting ATPase ATPase C chain